jgi:hypothetical protein
VDFPHHFRAIITKVFNVDGGVFSGLSNIFLKFLQDQHITIECAFDPLVQSSRVDQLVPEVGTVLTGVEFEFALFSTCYNIFAQLSKVLAAVVVQLSTWDRRQFKSTFAIRCDLPSQSGLCMSLWLELKSLLI